MLLWMYLGYKSTANNFDLRKSVVKQTNGAKFNTVGRVPQSIQSPKPHCKMKKAFRYGCDWLIEVFVLPLPVAYG